MRSIQRVCVGASGLVALTAAGPLPPISPAELGLSWLDSSVYLKSDGAGKPILSCSSVLKSSKLGDEKGHVRVVVSRAIFKKDDRDVSKITTNDDFDGEQPVPISQPYYTGIKSTRLDFETSKAKGSTTYKDNDYITVKVVLRKELRFILGHEISVPDGQNSICDVTPYQQYTKENSKKDKLYFVEFKVLLKKNSTDYSNYNIGVAVVDETDPTTVELPIFIDPKIKHDEI